MQNFIETSETILEKSVTNFFTHFNILAPQGDPLGHTSPVWVVESTNPTLATCKFSSRSDDPSPIYLLPNFVDFVAGVIHKKHTINDMSPH